MLVEGPSTTAKRGRRSRQEPTVRPARRDRPGPGERIGPACPAVVGSGGCRPLPCLSIRAERKGIKVDFTRAAPGAARKSRPCRHPAHARMSAKRCAPARVLRVPGGLLLSGRERPGGTGASISAKDEAELLGRAQPVGMIGAEGRARLGLGQRAEQVASEEAVLTPRGACSATGHGKWVLSNIDPATAWIKSGPLDRHNGRSRNTREKHPLHHEIPAYRHIYFAIAVSLRCTTT
jgi:hypothetical protein